MQIFDPFRHIKLSECEPGTLFRALIGGQHIVAIRLATVSNGRIVIAVLRHPSYSIPGHVDVSQDLQIAAFPNDCYIEPILGENSAPGDRSNRANSGILYLSSEGSFLQLHKLGVTDEFDILSFKLEDGSIGDYPRQAVPVKEWKIWMAYPNGERIILHHQVTADNS